MWRHTLGHEAEDLGRALELGLERGSLLLARQEQSLHLARDLARGLVQRRGGVGDLPCRGALTGLLLAHVKLLY